MSLLETVRRQHQGLIRLIGYLTLAEGEAEKRKLVRRLREEFESQERVEEAGVLKPLAETVARQGPEADPRLRSLLEEAGDRLSDIHDLFREIEMTGDAKELEAPLRELLRAIRNHIEEEEILLYPRIQSKLPPDQARRMEAAIEQAPENRATPSATRRRAA